MFTGSLVQRFTSLLAVTQEESTGETGRSGEGNRVVCAYWTRAPTARMATKFWDEFTIMSSRAGPLCYPRQDHYVIPSRARDLYCLITRDVIRSSST